MKLILRDKKEAFPSMWQMENFTKKKKKLIWLGTYVWRLGIAELMTFQSEVTSFPSLKWPFLFHEIAFFDCRLEIRRIKFNELLKFEIFIGLFVSLCQWPADISIIATCFYEAIKLQCVSESSTQMSHLWVFVIKPQNGSICC